MWRKLKRWSAMLLAAFLVFTSVQYTGLIAEAENSTTLDYISESTMCSVGESADGVEFSFDANYQELKFSLGQTVDATKIVSAKFDITGLTAGQKLALKLYDASGNEVGVKYDLSENFELAAADITGTAEVSAIGIMANVDGANGSAVFSGVDFKIQSGTEVVKSYKALDGVVALALNYQYGGVSYTGTSDGKLVITSQYAGQQLQMKPVSGLNIDDYKSITYNVSEINGSYTFAVSSWGGTYFTSEAKSEAGAHTFDISGNTGELNLFVFDNPADAGSMTVDSIVLTKNDDTTVTLTMPQEGYTVGNTQGTTSVTNGALTTTLGAGYNSTFITMPAAIAATDCDTVTINVSAVTGGVIIRPVDQATTWGDAGVCADVACSAAGACVVDMSTATGSIEQFRIMSTEADATLTIDSVVLSKSSYATVSFDTFTNVPSGDSGEGEGGDQPGDGGEGEGGDQPGDGGEGEGGEINDSEVTTTFEGWSEDSTSGDITADVDSASGAITFAGTGTYKQMFYAIPEDVDTTRLEKVVLNDVTGDAGKIFMKLLSEEQYTTDKWNSQIAAVYGATEVASDGVTEPKYLMIGLTDTATVTIGSITFALGETSIDDGGEGEGGEANDSEVTTTFEGWTEDSTSGDITADVDSASGAITFAGTGTYKQMFYAIPEDVDTTRLEKVVLNDVTGDADKIFMKLLSEEQYTTDKWNSQIAAVYGATEVASDGVTEPKYLMIGLTDTATVTIGSITFVLGETAIGGGGSGESTTVELTFNDIPIVANWDSTSEVDNTTGKITISNAVQYAQTFFEIPADIDVTRLDSVIVNGITGSYGLKLMTQAEYDEGKGNAAIVAYGNPTLSTAGATNIKYVVVMGMEPGTVTADSVTFKLRAAGETAPTTSTVEYHFGDITVASGYGHNRNVDEYNRLNLTFTQQYGEVKFAIPAELKDQIITGIKVTPVSGNTSTLAIKVYDTEAGMNSGNQMHVSWGGMNFSINPSKLVGVGFMATDSNDAVASNPLLIKKITFTVQGDFEGGSDFLSEVSYNFNDLTAAGGWNQVSSVTAKDGKLTMNFAEKYGEVQFAIPDEMLGKNITKMSFSTSVGNAADLAVKLYAGDTAVVTKYGETSFDISTEEDITKFAFMLNSDDVSPIVIDKVTFVVEADVENGSEFITEAYTTVPAAALEPVISGNAEVLDAEVNGGKLGINFNEEGAAVFFKIPSYVDMSKVKYVDLEDVASALSLVDTTYGTALNGVKLNAYTAADFATKTPTLTSDTSAVVTDGNANIKYIGLVSTAATASVSMTRVGFVEKNITKNGDMFSWTADNFVFDGTNSTASATAVDDNKWLCTFEEADDIAIFELPETFITGNAKDFAIAISKRDVPVVLSFLDAEMNEVWSTKNPERVQSYHNVDTVASRVDVKAKYLAISVKEGGAKMCVLDGISANKRVFSNEPYVVPTYTILTYTAADVLKMENDGWSGSTFEKLGETVKVNLPGTYGEISFKLPVKIDLAQCESVNIKLKNQNLPIAVKLMKNYDAVVVNYDRVLGERNFAPFSDAQINKFSLMSLESAPHSSAEFESITFTIKGDYVPEAISTGGIIVNGNFDDPDVSDWKAAFWDDVTITTEVSAKPIFGNVNTYGVYSKRTSPYQCFAQDITGRVVQDGTYTFSFWAKLSDDYKGAPDNQRVVQFSPYTVDVNGVPDYNPNLQGVYAQSLKVGEWTKYEGIWKITNANKIESVFVRILEQGTNYGQGDCVLGSYAITGVEIKEYIPDPPSIDEDVPDLKAALTQEFGDGFIVGTCISGNEFDDIGVEMLANKHFNAITLGNELKPDAMMGYSEKHTALQTITFNGQKLVVPTLTFASADTKLNQIIKWNKKHPESPIKVRGHVLVWHSQTMEWFFRENYEIGQNADGSENYVTPEEMNLRLEWYIKSVLEHYTGEDSPYKDLFYGWDVVNEAVSDGTGTYRTDTVTKSEKPSDTRHGSNSSWWAVYKSNEFVIKAFQFANKYAPAELELYYNDYNETDTRKVKGIVQLLKDVLAAEGTRIDAMGMQAHYNLYNPGMGSLEQAIRQYCAVVGKVQLTELDLKATDYIGSDTALAREYASQALHYKKIHDLLVRLDAQDGIDIAGVTFWGTIDTYSWLQEGSNVGGGSDGTAQHCPLLFDGNYKVKPAYWAWVDYSMVDPDYVADNTSGGSSTEKPEKDTDDKDETESTESVEQTESLTVPVIKDEEEKSSVAGPIAAVAGVVVVGAGLGAFFWNKKRKSIGE